ncbi:hypothetical protein GCM10011591_14020 [Nocardia camponoti]|uniref:Uncharacterized protein n=1 Tax=Nocardia camponoti TaxID=1616106 RepID=A0A917V5P7_9NOCA|nr:hypothetical protein GCM10011591_14020 [Nocardia camponoti]
MRRGVNSVSANDITRRVPARSTKAIASDATAARRSLGNSHETFTAPFVASSDRGEKEAWWIKARAGVLR